MGELLMLDWDVILPSLRRKIQHLWKANLK